MKKAIITILIVCLLAGCEEKQTTLHTVVSGYVYSTGSGKTIEGVRIYMYDGLPYSNKGSSRRDSTITDSNGYFHIELDGEEPVIFPHKEGYTFEYAIGGASVGIMPINPGSRDDDVKIFLDGIAHFSPVLMNKVPQTDEDTVKLYILYSKYGTEDNILNGKGNGPHYFWDPGIRDGFPILGDHYQKYRVKYERNNQWNVLIDSVYVALGEVYRDTIWY